MVIGGVTISISISMDVNPLLFIDLSWILARTALLRQASVLFAARERFSG